MVSADASQPTTVNIHISGISRSLPALSKVYGRIKRPVATRGAAWVEHDKSPADISYHIITKPDAQPPQTLAMAHGHLRYWPKQKLYQASRSKL